MINNLTSSDSESVHLEISKYLQEWIIDEWTSDFDAKPQAQHLQTIGDFTTYAKGYYSQISEIKSKASGFQTY